ncbi:YveK family protein [Furfurilactobacillus siliginis]|uniref:Polysaccharide chain length determinant N-terminal domain-containing protein n=1 Tax=Furfurilactobacillus siliginis TaxID=348151 RepID=A0A0R2LA36_9LACO|nr:Wzz/FepE/Etk N-terminal domain-containing protein [Furfurilactobacillus siliginis]KRN95316.1 hypothetical protein IV55_GL000303 [Furfurilactobacillus siliginis]GEK28286.1 hypothetical protein LSI01_05970 [Furfurilactobacillus siliginis]
MKTDYSIGELWKIFCKNILIVLLVGIVAGGATFAILKHQQKTTYTAHRSIVIAHDKNAKDSDSLTRADVLKMNTYAQIIDDPITTNRVYKSMRGTKGFTEDKNQLNGQISTTTNADSAVLTIAATNDSRNIAIKLANVTAKTVQKSLPKYIKHGGSVELLAPAEDHTVDTVTTPNVHKLTIYGLAAGLVLGAIVVFGIDLFKNQRR